MGCMCMWKYSADICLTILAMNTPGQVQTFLYQTGDKRAVGCSCQTQGSSFCTVEILIILMYNT